MSIGQAIRFGDKQQRKQWKKVFSTYIVTIYVVIIINVIGAVCTFGSALLLTVPASFMLFICEQFVNYYTVQGKKYFITYDRIAINRDRGDSEHFFETVEEPDAFSEPSEGKEIGEGAEASDLKNAEGMASESAEQVGRAENLPKKAFEAETEQSAEAGEESPVVANERNKKEGGEGVHDSEKDAQATKDEADKSIADRQRQKTDAAEGNHAEGESGKHAASASVKEEAVSLSAAEGEDISSETDGKKSESAEKKEEK